jgi:hypothetical protein
MTKRIKAFTLIETLLATTIATAIMMSISIYFVNIITTSQKDIITQELNYNINFAKTVITKTIKESTTIQEGNSTLESSPGSLVLTMPIGSESPTTISSISTNLTIQKGSGDPLSLITNQFQITNLIFFFKHPNNSPGTVTGNFTIQSKIDTTVTKNGTFTINTRTK